MFERIRSFCFLFYVVIFTFLIDKPSFGYEKTSTLAQSFYEMFNFKGHSPEDPPIKIPRSLKNYTEKLLAHHGLLDKVKFEIKDDSEVSDVSKYNYDPIQNTVLVPFTGGIDSSALALKLKEDGWIVYLLYINKLNNASAREHDAVMKFAREVGLLDNLIILEHVEKKKKKGSSKIVLYENPAKNQYIWLTALEQMKKFRCEKISFAIQDDADDETPYFSDEPEAFELFNEYIVNISGVENSLLFPATLKDPVLNTKQSYMLYLNEKKPEFYQKFSSCLKGQGRFKLSQIEYAISAGRVSNGICGSRICPKCSQIQKIFLSDPVFDISNLATMAQPERKKRMDRDSLIELSPPSEKVKKQKL